MRKVLAVLALVAVGCAGQQAESANARGREAAKAGKYREAVAAYGEAVKLAPDVTKYRYNLGLNLARAGAYDQAITELQEVVRLDPADVGARKVLARVQTAKETRQAELVADEIRH